MSELQRLRATVFGRVQGVSFRYNTMMRANEIGVTGWVRNLSNGTVEVVAEGTQEQMGDLIIFLNTGPTGARVSRVETEWLKASGEFEGFSIR